MLDDGGRRPVAEVVHQLPRRLGVEQVQVAESDAAVLVDAVPPALCADVAVAGTLLVRVLAVAQRLAGSLEGEVDRRRQHLGVGVGVVEPGDDGGVVRSSVGERGAGQAAPRGRGEGAVAEPQLVQHRSVVGRVDQHGDVRPVLGCGPHHGGPAHVDQLDRGVGPERVEVHGHEVDRLDAEALEVGHVGRVVPVGQQPPVQLRVQGDHAVAQHLGRPGDLLDRAVGDALSGQHPGGAAARDQVPAELDQALGQGRQTGLVVGGQECPHGLISSLRVAG